MNLLSDSPSSEVHEISCSECHTVSKTTVTRTIDQMPQVQELLDGTINLFKCSHCGFARHLDEAISVNAFPEQQFQFLPPQALGNPDVLEWLLLHRFGPHIVYSLNELALAVFAHLQIVQYREARRVRLKDIEIPPHIWNRIQGCYKKSKLKTIWYIASQFEPGRLYDPYEVSSIIGSALSRMDHARAANYDHSHIHSALRELKLLHQTAEGNHYWREGCLAG